MAEAQKLSKTYRQGPKRARILAAVLCWFGLALSAGAQEHTYSADSLTATFKKGSQISVKGTEIFLRDVVAEARNSRVIFKNSQSDRVICDLGPSAQREKSLALGSELRVKGRVRGQSFLGNVTLDDCSIAPLDESTATPSSDTQELATAEPEVATAEPEVATAEPDVISESEETLPVPSVPDRPPSSPKPSGTPPSAPRGAPRAAFVPSPVEQAPSLTAAPDHPENPIKPRSDSQSRAPYGFYALLVLSGAVASLILSKVLTAKRISKPPLHENTPEIRQAALQALLLKAEKKK